MGNEYIVRYQGLKNLYIIVSRVFIEVEFTFDHYRFPFAGRLHFVILSQSLVVRAFRVHIFQLTASTVSISLKIVPIQILVHLSTDEKKMKEGQKTER